MTRTIDASRVTIPEDRQRTEFPEQAHKELKDSIKTNGLLHPVILREGSVLAAGERRFRAMVELIAEGAVIRHGTVECPVGHIPFIDFGQLSELEAATVEFEENFRRLDPSWQDRARAMQKLEALCAANGKSTTRAALGEQANISGTTADRMLLAAKHLDDPEVAAAPTLKDAVKVIEKKAATTDRLKSLFTISNKPDGTAESIHTLLNGDSRELLGTLPAGSFDLILCDPPYGVGAQAFGEQSSGHNYDDSYESWQQLMPVLLSQTFRVAKADAHAYFFCDPRRYEELTMIARRVGWTPWHVPLIWDKSNGTLPEPDYGPRRTYEMIIFLRKGKRKILQVMPDVLRYSAVQNKMHAAQKPLELLCDLMSRSILPGQTVLDPCAGSGSIFPAANMRKVIATGIEQVMINYLMAKERMNGTE